MSDPASLLPTSKPLTAGRELDALIAERFFGYEWWVSRSSKRRCIYGPHRVPEHMTMRADGNEPLVADWADHRWTPAYSTDIAAAWLVVGKFTAQGHDVVIRPDGIGQSGVARVEIGMCDDGSFSSDREYCAIAPTTPHAICLAALQTLEAPHAV